MELDLCSSHWRRCYKRAHFGTAPITTCQIVFHTDPEEEISEEIMQDEDAKTLPDAHLMTSVHYQSKASASKSAYDFGSSSSTTPDGFSNSKLQEDDAATKPGPSTNPSFNQSPPQHSDFDSESSAGDYVDPFALLEIRIHVSDTMLKVSSVESSVTEINTKLDQKVSGLDAILRSLSQQSGPSAAEREAQLDQLMSLRLKHTMEEVGTKYDILVYQYLNTITSMLKVHDDLVAAANDLIKQNHVLHEKQIQRMEKEIKKMDEMNMMIQQVLIKLLCSTWNIVDVPNRKCDEMIAILSNMFKLLSD